MKQGTRDNLIYLAVGLSVAAFLTADFFFAESRGRVMWWPSRFAYRNVVYMGLLGYFVATETRKVKATLLQTATCVLVGSILHVGVVFTFRQTFADRFSINLFGLLLLEFLLIVQLMVQAVRYLGSRSGRT